MDLLAGVVALATANSLIFAILALAAERRPDLVDIGIMGWPWLMVIAVIIMRYRGEADLEN
jgi:hypothetical protein